MGQVLRLIGVGDIGESLGHSLEAKRVKLIEGGMFEQVVFSSNGSSAARGCWVKDRGGLRGALGAGFRSSLLSRMDLTEP